MSEDLANHSSPAPAPAPLPDNDDILREILLRLPPLPSSLPRASLVCKRWSRLLSDPRFRRRFLAFHRRNLPLLGIFLGPFDGLLHFIPTLDPPDCIPSARLSLQVGHGGEIWQFCGCRHGLGLILNLTLLEVAVWDPVSGDQHRVAFPPGWFGDEDPLFAVCNAALLCAHHHAGGMPLESYKVILLHGSLDGDPQVFASVYESDTGLWGDVISIAISAPVTLVNPSVLARNSLFWLPDYYGNEDDDGHPSILEFDLDRETLAMIDGPMDTEQSSQQILRMEGGELGVAALSDVVIQLWEKNASSDSSVARWTLQKSINLNELLSVGSPIVGSWTILHGYDEDGHVLFISTGLEVFMINLKSMQFRNLFKTSFITNYHAYTGIYTIGRGNGNEDVRAETLNNT